MAKLTYTTVDAPFQFEIPKIKGSRFITSVFPIDSKDHVPEYLSQVQKQYFWATHHCYAWRVGVRVQEDLFWGWNIVALAEKVNDDWEPSNTAGKPILNVLKWDQIFGILAVVTRYFWGTLLGVGGLIQAYTLAIKSTLTQAPLLQKEITKKLMIHYRYEEVSRVQHLFAKYQAIPYYDEYGDIVTQGVEVNYSFFQNLTKDLTSWRIDYEEVL